MSMNSLRINFIVVRCRVNIEINKIDKNFSFNIVRFLNIFLNNKELIL